MATLNPYSLYVGRKMAAYRIETNGNYDLPKYSDIIDNNYEFCEFLLIWEPSLPFLKKIDELWKKHSHFDKAKKRYWAEDVVDSFRQGLIEIFVHQKLKENLITAADISMDDNIFKDFVNQDYLESSINYKCLATAFEYVRREDIVFAYIHLKAIFGSTNTINRKWMNKYTFQDMKDGTFPVDKILKG